MTTSLPGEAEYQSQARSELGETSLEPGMPGQAKNSTNPIKLRFIAVPLHAAWRTTSALRNVRRRTGDIHPKCPE